LNAGIKPRYRRRRIPSDPSSRSSAPRLSRNSNASHHTPTANDLDASTCGIPADSRENEVYSSSTPSTVQTRSYFYHRENGDLNVSARRLQSEARSRTSTDLPATLQPMCFSRGSQQCPGELRNRDIVQSNSRRESGGKMYLALTLTSGATGLTFFDDVSPSLSARKSKSASFCRVRKGRKCDKDDWHALLRANRRPRHEKGCHSGLAVFLLPVVIHAQAWPTTTQAYETASQQSFRSPQMTVPVGIPGHALRPHCHELSRYSELTPGGAVSRRRKVKRHGSGESSL